MNRPRIEPLDVRHLGRERVICCWRVGETLIDPGPESSIEAVFEAIGEQTPRAVLATHIHLDHSGGIGALVRRWPELTVYVHEIGAPHLADPSKLLVSAERLYGDRMKELWGEVLPVPERNIFALSGGETVEGFEVAYTPGHASHHVSYLDRESGAAFVGDTCGVRVPPCDYILAPTPPPDIDVEAWYRSLEAIGNWQPDSLHLTHFGSVDAPGEHLDRFRTALMRAVELAQTTTAEEYARRIADEITAAADDATAAALAQAAPLEHLHPGLARYLRKQAEVGS